VENSSRLPRKLAAILYADVAGYSRLTGSDEDATHRRLSDSLDLIATAIEEHRGQVVHYAGDAVLAMFEAAVDALASAEQIQRRLAGRNANLSDDEKLQFRVGVNLGDVIEDRDDIYGDGVNVAARLEGLAEPGGICVSESIHTAVGHNLALDYEFIGEQQVKNIETPVRAYRVVVDKPPVESPDGARTVKPGRGGVTSVLAGIVGVAVVVAIVWFLYKGTVDDEVAVTRESAPDSTTPEPATTPTPAESDRPAIAVLPFDNLSNDPEQEYFSDGLTEDLITDLSRVSGLMVIARNSSFVYKDQAVNVKQIGSELGVRYVLEGSVRKSNQRVRINAQLIDVNTGMHVWADRYDRDLTDVFALQDEVTETIVKALAVSLTSSERARMEKAPVANPDAYDVLLRGNEQLQLFTAENNIEAREHYHRAIALDRRYARAHANLAFTHALDLLFGWSNDRQESIRLGLASSEDALALDDRSERAYFVLANLYVDQQRTDDAMDAAHRALAIDPNYADAYVILSISQTYAGQHEEALKSIESASRLNPRGSFIYTWVKGRIFFFLQRLPEAAALLEEAVDRNPLFDQSRIILAATYGEMDRLEDAAWQAEEILALHPDFTIAVEIDRGRYQGPGDMDRYLSGLRKAGLPE
jgi:adenylate cyclase